MINNSEEMYTPTVVITTAPVHSSTPDATPTKFQVTTQPPSTPTATTEPVVLTPTPTPHPLQSKLPLECQYERSEFPIEFYQELYTFDAQACKKPVLSPDQNWLAYVTLEPTTDVDGHESVIEVVKIISLTDKKVTKIYQEYNFSIGNLEWSSDGHLVILDASAEYVGSHTIIFDVDQMQIMQEVNGYFWSESWNRHKTAFFTQDRDSSYSPHCKDFISGFDFGSQRLFPSERLLVEQDEIIRILEGPYWIEDGQTFIFSARKGLAEAELEDKTYGPSMALMVKLESGEPQMLILKSDPDIDYVLNWQENGTYEITEEPYQPLSCWDIYVHETGGDF